MNLHPLFQVEILRNAILYIQSLERCLGISHNPEEAKLVSSYKKKTYMDRFDNNQLSLQDKIEDTGDVRLDRKEADDINEVFLFLDGETISHSLILGFVVCQP